MGTQIQADLKVSDIVTICRVSKNTVHDWIRAGTLKACNVAKPGSKRPSYRIPHQAFEEFRTNQATAKPDEPSEKPISNRRKLPSKVKRFF